MEYKDRTLDKGKLGELLQGLLKDSEVWAPVLDGDQAFFRKISSEEDVSWEFGNTVIPPHELMLPQAEVLFRFEKRGQDIKLSDEPDTVKRTIIGIRPCDVHGILLLDTALKENVDDPYYVKKREGTTLISLMCSNPGPNCFCSSLGTGPDLDPGSGADLMLIDLGERFYVRVLSEKGQGIVNGLGGLFSEPSDADRKAAARCKEKVEQGIGRTLELEGVPQVLEGMFDSDYWVKISRKCIGCGTCTYLCPTCYCFDVVDNCSHPDGERVRCWDSCTYPSFTLLAGGHNPRPTIAERYRQKIYHKFKFAFDRYDKPLCVGCGRCLDSCPVNLDIVRVISELRGGP